MSVERRIAEVLAGFSIVSEGSSTRFPDAIVEPPASHKTRRAPGERPKPQGLKANTNRQHGESQPPRGSGQSEYDYWKGKLERAVEIGGPALNMAIEEAEVALKVAQKRPEILPSEEDERAERIIEEYVGWSPEAVAAKFRCTPDHVRTLRERWPLVTPKAIKQQQDPDPRDPETGEPYDPTERQQMIAMARAYSVQGLNHNQIALRMGRERSTVMRWLGGERRAA